jgi:polysaccharide export outer membrane protein
MNSRVWLLVFWIGAAPLWGAETNLVEILRRFQATLDAQEKKRVPETPAPVLPVPARALDTRAEDPEHVLAARDVVELKVEGEPDMSLLRAEVSADGTILHPVAGSIAVGGKTVAQARSAIHELLARDYLVSPDVKLRLLEPGRCTFTILQQVAKPGTYSWRCGEPMTILRAIALAGGPTRKAALARITVRRQVEGSTREIQVDLDQLNRDREAKPFLLQAGDVVEVASK